MSVTVVRAVCGGCGSERVPAYKTVRLGRGRYLVYRRCSECGWKGKGQEVAATLVAEVVMKGDGEGSRQDAGGTRERRSKYEDGDVVVAS